GARPAAAVTPGSLAIEITGETGGGPGCRENGASCLGLVPSGGPVPAVPPAPCWGRQGGGAGGGAPGGCLGDGQPGADPGDPGRACACQHDRPGVSERFHRPHRPGDEVAEGSGGGRQWAGGRPGSETLPYGSIP